MRPAWGLLLACAVPAGWAQAPVQIEKDAVAVMRDGVKLKADIYRPAGPGPFPVMLARTPYGKGGANGRGLAERGYLAVIQDTRGRGQSEGVFRPFLDDERDGYDTVEWAAALPGSNGKVGMFGGSYGGATQLLAAAAAPPHLVAVFAVVPAVTFGAHGVAHEGGAFRLLLGGSWGAMQLVQMHRLKLGPWAASGEKFSEVARAGPPLGLMDRLFGKAPASFWPDWVAEPPLGEYWQPTDLVSKIDKIRVPVCLVGGSFDPFAGATVGVFAALRKRAATPEARQGAQLWFGPWTHGGSKFPAGDVQFGPDAAVSFGEYERKWQDHWLKGEANEVPRTPPARVYLTGEQRWQGWNDWPPAESRARAFALGAETIVMAGKAAGGVAVIETNPADPAPTRGGKLCCHPGFLPGSFDHSALFGRAGVAVFRSTPLTAPLTVIGDGALEADLIADQPDGDLVAKLFEVRDGKTVLIADGVTRLRHARALDRADPVAVGKSVRIRVDLGPLSHRFLPGGQMALLLAGADFPNYDLNPAAGPARLRIRLGGRTLLRLPVVETLPAPYVPEKANR